jgi:Alpha-kinase family
MTNEFVKYTNNFGYVNPLAQPVSHWTYEATKESLMVTWDRDLALGVKDLDCGIRTLIGTDIRVNLWLMGGWSYQGPSRSRHHMSLMGTDRKVRHVQVHQM